MSAPFALMLRSIAARLRTSASTNTAALRRRQVYAVCASSTARVSKHEGRPARCQNRAALILRDGAAQAIARAAPPQDEVGMKAAPSADEVIG